MRMIRLGIFALAFGGCTDTASEPTFTINSQTSSRVQATLELDGERFVVDSTSAMVPGLTGFDDDGAPLAEPAYAARVTSIVGDRGGIYAQFTVPVDHYEPLGSFGGQAFGTVATADTDMDPSYWAPVADGRAGDVLAALSAAVTPHLDGSASLGDLANMSSVLRGLAQELPEIYTNCDPEVALLDEDLSTRSASTCSDRTAAGLAGVCSMSHYWVSIWNGSSRLVVKYGATDVSVTKAVSKGQTIIRRGHYGDDQGHGFWGPTRTIGVPNNCNFDHEWCDRGRVAGCG